MAGVIAVGGLVYVFVLKEIGDLGNYYILVSGIGLDLDRDRASGRRCAVLR